MESYLNSLNKEYGIDLAELLMLDAEKLNNMLNYEGVRLLVTESLTRARINHWDGDWKQEVYKIFGRMSLLGHLYRKLGAVGADCTHVRDILKWIELHGCLALEPFWGDSETLDSTHVKNPLIPMGERLLIADGAIKWRDRLIKELRERTTNPTKRVKFSRDLVRSIMLQNGYTIKEGQTDLKEYVYSAAADLLELYTGIPHFMDSVSMDRQSRAWEPDSAVTADTLNGMNHHERVAEFTKQFREAYTDKDLDMALVERTIVDLLGAFRNCAILTPPAAWYVNKEHDPFRDSDYPAERASLPNGGYSDYELANAVYLCDHRNSIASMGLLTAAKERMRWLSKKNMVLTEEKLALQKEVDALKTQLQQINLLVHIGDQAGE